MKKTFAVVLTASILLSFIAGYFFSWFYGWRNHREQRGFLSFTFDDNRMGQYVHARPILEETGFKATFYVTRDNFDADSSFFGSTEVRELYDAGHEIGDHTKTHRVLTNLSETEIEWEIDADYLKSLGINPRTHAYPYGSYNSTVISLVSQHYDYARTADSGTRMGLESPPLNAYGLNARVVEKDTSVTNIKNWIDEAMVAEKWLILTFHNIVESPSAFTDYSISDFQEIVTYAKARGIIVRTLVEIADQLTFQSNRATGYQFSLEDLNQRAGNQRFSNLSSDPFHLWLRAPEFWVAQAELRLIGMRLWLLTVLSSWIVIEGLVTF